MKTVKKIIYSENEIDKVVQALRSAMSGCAVFTFTGSLGAGKTTLIRELLRACGVQDPVSSPTFNYVNWYRNNLDHTFYHFDLYRLHDVHDFVDAGFAEYLYQQNSWSFIEWPEIVLPLLDRNVCHCSIDYHGLDKRVITIEQITNQ